MSVIYVYTLPQPTLAVIECHNCLTPLAPHTSRWMVVRDAQGAFILCPACNAKHYAPKIGRAPAIFHAHGELDGTNTQRWCGIDGAYVKATVLTVHCPRCSTRFDATLMYSGTQLIALRRWTR